MTKEKSLSYALRYRTTFGYDFTLKVPRANPNLAGPAVRDAMNSIRITNFMRPPRGPIESIVGADLVTTTTTRFNVGTPV